MVEDTPPQLALVGLMGAGKSAVGAAVAARVPRRHVDLDLWIQNDTGRTIGVLFAESGESGFRDAEATTLSRVLEMDQPIVLSTGGGVLIRPENRALLAARAVVVWLRAAPETLAGRVGDGTGRPLLAGGDPLAVLQRLCDERGPAYAAAADAVVDTDGCAVDEVVDTILALDAVGAHR